MKRLLLYLLRKIESREAMRKRYNRERNLIEDIIMLVQENPDFLAIRHKWLKPETREQLK